jgi:hypothetical protein
MYWGSVLSIKSSDDRRTQRVCLKVPIHVRVWLGSGPNEPNPSVWGATSRARPSPAGLARAFGGARLVAGSLLARTCVGGPEPDSRIHTATRTDSVSFVTKGGTMSASMSKTFMSPDFWKSTVNCRFCGKFAAQIIRTGQSGVRPGIYSYSSRERKSQMLTCFDELILDTEMYEQSSECAHACVVKYIRAGLASQTRTCMGAFRGDLDQQL